MVPVVIAWHLRERKQQAFNTLGLGRRREEWKHDLRSQCPVFKVQSVIPVLSHQHTDLQPHPPLS